MQIVRNFPRHVNLPKFLATLAASDNPLASTCRLMWVDPLIGAFYFDDENSHLMPGMKDFVFVK